MARAKGRYSVLKSSVSGKIPLNTQMEFGEFAVNLADGVVFVKVNDPSDPDGQIIQLQGSLPQSFLSLTDTPVDYTGQDGKVLSVDETNGQLIFIDPPSGGGSSYQFGNGLNVDNGTTPPTVNAIGGNGIDVTATSINVVFGTTAGTVAEGNHTHNTDDISEGSTNLYFTNSRAASNVTFANLNANGDVGSGPSQVAMGNHTHSIGDMTDVDITGVQSGDILSWNGTDFTPVGYSFNNLPDTPNSFVADRIVKVNSLGNSLEYVDFSTLGVSSITAGNGLDNSGTATDPVLFVGAGDGVSVGPTTVSVNFDANGTSTQVSRSDHVHNYVLNDLGDVDTTGLQARQTLVYNGTNFVPENYNFISLDGTPSSYGNAGDVLLVNTTTDAIEFYDPDVVFVTSVIGGAGLINNGGSTKGVVTLDVGAGDGIIVAADSISVSYGGNGTATTVSRSDHTHNMSIDDLNDVNISGGVNGGQVLKWNGSQFIPADEAAGGISDAPLDGNSYSRNNGTWVQTIDSLSDDSSPTLGGNLSVGSYEIIADNQLVFDSTNLTNTTITSTVGKNLAINPSGDAILDPTGDVVIQGLVYPNGDGSSGDYLTTDGAGNLSWASLPLQVTQFTNLTDTPSSYVGEAGKHLVVNGTENGIEFVSVSYLTSLGAGDGLINSGTAIAPVLDVVAGDGISVAANSVSVDFGGSGSATTVSRSDHVHDLDGLIDVDLTGLSTGDIIQYNGTNFVPVALDFIDLGDTPVTYSGYANKVVAVNSTADGLEFIDPPAAGVSSVTAGNGLSDSGTASDPILDVGAGDGITVAADTVSVNFGGTGSATTVARSDHTHNYSIDNLSDVDTTTSTPNVGDILEWDGTNWVPGTTTGNTSNFESIRVNYLSDSITSTQDASSGIISANIVESNTKISFTFSHSGPPRSIIMYGYKANIDGNGNSGYKMIIPPTATSNNSYVLTTSNTLPSITPGSIVLHCDRGQTQADASTHGFIFFLF